jgi:uncharacterized RDD family membrane protein YckC
VTTGVSAGFGRRLAALLYDALLMTALLVTFTTAAVMLLARTAITPETAGPWAYVYRACLLLILAGYYLLNWTRSGQTLGMRAWRLRAVSELGTRIGWKSAALRLGLSLLAWMPLGLGVLWLYFDSEHAALQDRLSRTRIVHLARS